MFCRITVSGIILAGLLGITIAQQDARDIAIKPNEEVQSFLHALSSTNIQERQKLFPAGTTEDDFKQKLNELQKEAGGTQKFIQQLLYFSVHARSTRQGMLPLTLVEQLNISPDDRVAAIVPLLETGDQSVQKEAYEWLQVIDFDGNAQKFKFNRHEDVIRKAGPDVPKGLVKYMYAKSPDAALSTMANVYLKKDEAKALMDKARDKDEAKALDLLSKRSEWWTHLYVTEKMRKNAKLRSPAVLERMKKSKNPLVQDAMKHIEKK